MNKNELIEVCMNSIYSSFEFLIKNPTFHFSEKDIHWLICRDLDRAISKYKEEGEDELFNTNYLNYSTTLIHQEYGTLKKTHERTDIVVLDSAEVQSINEYGLRIKSGKNSRYLCPIVSIEVSTEKKMGGKKKPDDLVRQDSEKLKKTNSDKEVLIIFYRCKNKRGVEQHKEKFINPLKVVLEKIWTERGDRNLTVLVAIIYLEKECGEIFVDGNWSEIQYT
ncbi:MAG: hypothetical protein ACXQS5_02575 [Candidatus Methanospirareceae archaeon]